MKRLALLLVALGSVATASAQSLPPDVPANHWAAGAVSDLYRLGVLRGYPDGLYRGSRPATRYELAVALNGLFGVQQTELSRIQSQIDELRRQPRTPQQDVEGLATMRRRVETLETEVVQIQGYRKDIDELTTTFENLIQQVRELREKARSRG